MLCPVCRKDHIRSADALLSGKEALFSPCPKCVGVTRNKSSPPDGPPPHFCHCGRAFIDDVYVALYQILVDEGLFNGDEPLSAVGIPLIDPGIFLRAPPFLPARSLLLLSSAFDQQSAVKAFDRISQLSGILLDGHFLPGIGDITSSSNPVSSEHHLLCGCDVRADIFSTTQGPVVIYKKQASTHIEVPHGIDLKIRSIERAIRRVHPHLLVDACCGAGTLGIAGLKLGVHDVLLNDPWYAAAYFTGFNLNINKKILGLEECVCCGNYSRFSQDRIRGESEVVADGFGCDHAVQVFQGRMDSLTTRISDPSVLTVFDPFDKKMFRENAFFLSSWRQTVGGEVFIP